jgi:hypothetical protein
MDEYTFILLAKLKADRLKLERQQANGPIVPTDEPDAVSAHRSRRARWSSPAPEDLPVSTHGLRGWS